MAAVAANINIKGRGFAAGCVERLCSLRSRGDGCFAAEGCGIAHEHACGVRVDGPNRPKVLKVLRFDGPFGPKGCGIALRAMSFVIPLRGMENHTTELRPQGGSPVLSS